MTHDELLAKIEMQSAHLQAGENPYMDALRAVVELHKPHKNMTGAGTDSEPTYTEICNADFPTLYPCKTILVIEKELK